MLTVDSPSSGTGYGGAGPSPQDTSVSFCTMGMCWPGGGMAASADGGSDGAAAPWAWIVAILVQSDCARAKGNADAVFAVRINRPSLQRRIATEGQQQACDENQPAGSPI